MGNDLASFLIWFATGGGAGIVAFWLIEQAKQLWPSFDELSAEIKWYISLTVTALLACAAFAAEVGFQYQPLPVGWQGWVEALFAVALVAIVAATSIYRRKKASK